MSKELAWIDRRKFRGVPYTRIFIAALVNLATLGVGRLTHAEVSSGITNSPTTNDLSGVYGCDDGAKAIFYAPKKASQYVLKFVQRDEAPMTVYLRGDPSALTPVGMDVTVKVDGLPMEISGIGDRLYARTSTKAGTSLEYLSDSEKGTRRAVSGKISARDNSPAEAEAGMMLGDFSQQWNRLRHVKVMLTTNVLRIASPGVVEPRSFIKQEPLSTNEISLLGEKIEGRKNALTAVDKFINNERKIEVEP